MCVCVVVAVAVVEARERKRRKASVVLRVLLAAAAAARRVLETFAAWSIVILLRGRGKEALNKQNHTHTHAQTLLAAEIIQGGLVCGVCRSCLYWVQCVCVGGRQCILQGREEAQAQSHAHTRHRRRWNFWGYVAVGLVGAPGVGGRGWRQRIQNRRLAPFVCLRRVRLCFRLPFR